MGRQVKKENFLMMKFDGYKKWSRILPVLFCLVITLGCASPSLQSKSGSVPEARSKMLAGYLAFDALPDSLALLPPPPAGGSAAAALDEEVNSKNLAQRFTPRWALAARDADLSFPNAAGTFSCALNIPVSEQDTPHLYMLLRRSSTDAIVATLKAKVHYRRTRPFVMHKTPSCTPDWDNKLKKDGSYPSGHSAIGWTWALILSEIDPERSDAVLARGRAFGESRLVCHVHWQSDVIAGRFMGAAVVDRLHANPVFLADLQAAKAEIAAVRARGLLPTRHCSDEAAVLSRQPTPAP
jgi:acid phosphatase (class A)